VAVVGQLGPLPTDLADEWDRTPIGSIDFCGTWLRRDAKGGAVAFSRAGLFVQVARPRGNDARRGAARHRRRTGPRAAMLGRRPP